MGSFKAEKENEIFSLGGFDGRLKNKGMVYGFDFSEIPHFISWNLRS